MSILTRNNVHVRGSGKRPMLFAHGFGCDQNMWRYVAPAFEEDFRTVLLIKPFTFASLASKVRAVLDLHQPTP